MSRPASDLSQRAVRAAIELATKAGIGGVTFDAVARHLEVSKGAVIHYFPSKGALIEAMVETLVADHRTNLERLRSTDREPVGRFARAMLNSATNELGHDVERGLLSALLEEPTHAEAMREHWRWCYEELEADGIPPRNAALIMMATDGIWLTSLLGLPTPSESAHTDALAWLEELTRPTTPSSSR